MFYRASGLSIRINYIDFDSGKIGCTELGKHNSKITGFWYRVPEKVVEIEWDTPGTSASKMELEKSMLNILHNMRILQ